jgi:hypothetical protein
MDVDQYRLNYVVYLSSDSLMSKVLEKESTCHNEAGLLEGLPSYNQNSV